MKYLLCGFIFLMASTSCFGQQLYRWVDHNGLVHFSDQAPMPRSTPNSSSFKSSTSRACLKAQDKLELFKEGLWVPDKPRATHGPLSDQERREAMAQIQENIRTHCPLAKAVK